MERLSNEDKICGQDAQEDYEYLPLRLRLRAIALALRGAATLYWREPGFFHATTIRLLPQRPVRKFILLKAVFKTARPMRLQRI